MTTANDATKTGASAEGTEEGAQRAKSLREEMLERIDERVDQSRVDQIQAQDAATRAATDADAILVDDPKRFKLRVVIGDREEERSLDAVLSELQTSQGRLRAVTQREKDLTATIAEKDRQLEAQLAAQLGGGSAADGVDVDASIALAMEALVDGDADKAAAAIKEVLQTGRQAATSLDETALIGKVKDTLKAEQTQEKAQAETVEVWEKFVTEFPEFATQIDPVTQQEVVGEARQFGDFVFERDFASRVAAGELSYHQALKETATAVRKVFAGKGEGKSDPPAKTDFELRQERKREIDTLPVASGARDEGTGAQADESRADVIKEMRKKRGLPA